MKKVFYFLFVASLVMLFASCEKSNQQTVDSGTVVLQNDFNCDAKVTVLDKEGGSQKFFDEYISAKSSYTIELPVGSYFARSNAQLIFRDRNFKVIKGQTTTVVFAK